MAQRGYVRARGRPRKDIKGTPEEWGKYDPNAPKDNSSVSQDVLQRIREFGNTSRTRNPKQ